MLRCILLGLSALLIFVSTSYAEDEEDFFDKPIKTDVVKLPKNPELPDNEPSITCDRYAGYMVKQIDMGELGAAKLAILPADAACEETTAGEKVIKDDMVGYFMGAKGNFVVFSASDGFNGGLPVVVMDAATQKHLFDFSTFLGEDGEAPLFSKLEVKDKTFKASFTNVYSADCSLYDSDKACVDKVKAATSLATLPDCKKVYDDMISGSPEYADDIKKSGSVLVYDVDLVYENDKVTITPVPNKETVCFVPE